MSTTPAGSGGRPAVVQSSSAHAATWAERPAPADNWGVHDARTSISARAPPPTCRRKTRSTPTSRCRWGPGSRQRAASASISQDQPTLARSGSEPFRVNVGASEAHTAERPLPSGVAGRVVQQDQAPAADLRLVDHDIGSDGGRERGDPLRCWNFLDDQLRSPGRRQQLWAAASEDVRAGAASEFAATR